MQCLVLLMNNLKNPNCFEKAEAGGRKKIKNMDLTDKLSNEVQTKPILLLTYLYHQYTTVQHNEYQLIILKLKHYLKH